MITDLRQAIHALVRWRLGAIAAVLTLGVAIGATTSLYAFARLGFAEFPGVPDLDRVCRVYASSQSLGVERAQVALNEFDATLSHATSFEAIGAYAQIDATLGNGADARDVAAGYASPAFFAVMGVPPLTGRVFTSADADARQPVAIISEALWRRQFPDGQLTNATVRIDGLDRAVIGVMPRTFSYGFVGIDADVWVPLARTSRDTPPVVAVFARLRPGVGWTAAASELSALGRGRGPWTWRAIPISQDTRFRAASVLAFTLGPGLVVLLIGCVNVACLLLARGIERDKELSVRRALGATRLRVIRQLFTENVVLAAVGGALGSAMAIGFLRVIAAELAVVQPAIAERLTPDARLLPLALVSMMVACVLFGTVPALRLSRRDVAASLNGVPARHRIHIAGYGARDLVVFLETGSAVGLIVFAAMLFTLFGEMRRVTLAFPADHVVAVRVPAHEVDAAAVRIAALPGVSRVTVTSGMIGGRGGASAARVQAAGAAAIPMSRVPVGDAFLETLGIPLIRGRSFDRTELKGRAPVAVVSESAARRLSPTGDPLGTRIRIEGRTASTAVVIGICRDAIDFGRLSRAGLVPPEIYVPFEPPLAGDPVVLARVTADAHQALRIVADAAASPGQRRLPRPSLLADEGPFHDAGAAPIILDMFGAFGVIALLLAGSGVFAVISQSVAQRTTEFGIRMALGARPSRVLCMVLARETKLIAAALGSGAVFTFGLTRALFAELFVLSTAAPVLWIGVMCLCGGIAAVACLLATGRIVRLDPMVVLRRT